MKKLIKIILVAFALMGGTMGCSHVTMKERMKAFARGYSNSQASSSSSSVEIVDNNGVHHFCSQQSGTISNCH